MLFIKQKGTRMGKGIGDPLGLKAQFAVERASPKPSPFDQGRGLCVVAEEAYKTGDFSEIEKLSLQLLNGAEKRWEPHHIQDEKCHRWNALPRWRKWFTKRPYGGPLPGRVSAAENVFLAKQLRDDVIARDREGLKCFFDWRH